MTETPDPFSAPFGTLFGEHFSLAAFVDGNWEYGGAAQPLQDLALHPGSHVLHYGSACFEGLKSHAQQGGGQAIFRLDDHVARFGQTADLMRLPYPEHGVVRQMILDAVSANAASVPEPPGSLYIRPTLIGTENNIGAAASPSSTALLYILNSPVGDYFAGGIRPLTLAIQTSIPRTTPQFGMVKAGANYVMALGPTLDAKRDHAADQVLFAPGGDVTETGASNFFLVDDNRLITRNLDSSFLHGVTRASVVTIAADLGYTVEERELDIDEVLAWREHGEVFLSGTAAVIAPVGTLVLDAAPLAIRDGQPGPNTLKIRKALTDLQVGAADDPYGWRTPVA